MSPHIAENNQTHWGTGSHVRWTGHPTPLESYQLFMSPLRNQVQAIKANTSATSTEAMTQLVIIATEISPELLWKFWLHEARHLEMTPLGAVSGPNRSQLHAWKDSDLEAPAYARKTHFGVTLTLPEQRHLALSAALAARMKEISDVHTWLMANKGAFLSEQRPSFHPRKQSRVGKIVAALKMPISAWLKKGKSKEAMSPAYIEQLDAFFQLAFDYGAIEREWDGGYFVTLVPDALTTN